MAKSRKPPTPAQLAAREKFTRMVRARAAERAKEKKNQGPCAYCGGPGGVFKGPGHSFECSRYEKPRRRVKTIGRKKTNSSQGLKRSKRKLAGTIKAIKGPGSVARFRQASKQYARAVTRGKVRKGLYRDPSRLPNPRRGVTHVQKTGKRETGKNILGVKFGSFSPLKKSTRRKQSKREFRQSRMILAGPSARQGRGSEVLHLKGGPRGRLPNPVIRSASRPCRNCAGSKVKVTTKGAHCASCGLRVNPGVIRFTEADARKYAGKIKGLGAPPTRARSRASGGSRKAAPRGIKATAKAIGRNIVRGLGMAHNPTGRKVIAGAYRSGALERRGSPGSLRKLYKQIPGTRVKRGGKKRNPYQTRFIQQRHAADLVNLYHLARVELSGTGKSGRYEQMLVASKWFAKEHPGVSSTGAYKDLDGLLRHNPGREHLPTLPMKYQRMYEDVLASERASGKHPGREKEIAARTVWKAVEHNNPRLAARLNPIFSAGRRMRFGWVDTSKRGKGSKAWKRAAGKRTVVPGKVRGLPNPKREKTWSMFRSGTGATRGLPKKQIAMSGWGRRGGRGGSIGGAGMSSGWTMRQVRESKRGRRERRMGAALRGNRKREGLSKRGWRNVRITRAAGTYWKVSQRGRKTGPGRLPNPLRGSYEIMGFKRGKSGLATGRRQTVGTVKAFTRWGAQRKAARMEKKTGMFLGATKRVRRGRGGKKKYGFSLFNPRASEVYNEFRGKEVSSSRQVLAAAGTPSPLAKLGGLYELHLRGRRLRFNTSRVALASDSRKHLHITGARFQVRGNPGGEVDMGEVLGVTYRADKPHIEEGTFNYVHKFGEEGGTRPHLIIDEEGYPKLEGGSYDITEDGIID